MIGFGSGVEHQSIHLEAIHRRLAIIQTGDQHRGRGDATRGALLIHQRHDISSQALIVIANNLRVVIKSLDRAIFQQKTLIHQNRISRLKLGFIPVGDARLLLGTLLGSLLLELLNGLIEILSEHWAAQTESHKGDNESFHTASVLLLERFDRNSSR